MTNTPDISALSAQDAAAAWLVARDQGLDLATSSAFQDWLKRADANAQAWTAAEASWNALSEPDDLLEAMRRDALAARPERRRPTFGMAIAAGIALMVVAGSYTWMQLRPAYKGANDAGTVLAANSTGPASFTLEDGSQVTLNKNARVAVQYAANVRNVRLLQGEAYFTVMHNAARPFKVRVQDNVISDIGTEFDIYTDGKNVSVILAKGSVAIDTATSKAATLQPGQKMDIRPGTPDRVSPVILADSLAWRLGFIEFQDEPLEKVVEEINKYGGAPAKLVDPAIRTKRVSGRFRVGDPSRFARSLAETYHLRITKRADGGVDIAGH